MKTFKKKKIVVLIHDFIIESLDSRIVNFESNPSIYSKIYYGKIIGGVVGGLVAVIVVVVGVFLFLKYKKNSEKIRDSFILMK